MQKKLIIILLCLFIFTACSSDKTIVYSNLGNNASQQELIKILKGADLPNSNIEQFINYVNDFNQFASSLVGDFKELPTNDPHYDYFNYNGDSQSDVDSLIPSFTLIKDLISTNNNANENDTYLMYNLELINKKKYSISKADRLKFITTFNSISVSGIKNNKISHINQIKKTFNDRNFEVKGNNNISLITLWCHFALENRRFVSHCGVLIDEGVDLCFIEKYGSSYPYQITKFNNRKELTTYLLSRDDINGDENDGQPLIFENNEYIGY